ncbi:MAG: xanthine dehydrogenase [Candidatus Poribacteria bacterium]|nr:MAG: xanthine dehydrogenase [Candidatus Poribacteria bacterium]
MAVIPWKPPAQMDYITKDNPRLDGPAKVTGRAKYAYDAIASKCLVGRMITCPYPNAKAVRIDTSEAEKLPGVKAILVEEGKVCRLAGEFVGAVAAVSADIADDAVRLIRIEWERYPFVTREEDAVQPNAPQVHAGNERPNVRVNDPDGEGDVEAAFQQADAIYEGTLSTQVQTHTCLEPHGTTAVWDENLEHLTVWASTQAVFGVRNDLAEFFGLEPHQVEVITEYMGGGFGSKLGGGYIERMAARLAREARQPVKLLLTREQEQTNSGNRPSARARVRAGATKDGKLIAFEAETSGTGGFAGGSGFPLPYIYSVPNWRRQHTDVYINAGNARAMRAPGHPQGSFIMEAVMDELAYRLGMDPIEFRIQNDPNETRRRQFRELAKRLDWDRLWKPGPDEGFPLKRGMGVGAAVWGGGGHGSNAEVEIHPDGSVVVRCGTQDIGTGTRTVVGVVAAEQTGLSPEAITVQIGHSTYPQSGSSGGSTTCAGVAPAVKVATDNALWELFLKVAPVLEASPEELEAADGTVRVKGDPSRALSWKEACAVLGQESVVGRGRNDRSLSSSGTAGVCGVDLEVDVETGRIHLRRIVSIQECGLVVNKLTTESQMIGGVIQGISYALFEDRIMDRMLGHQINPNLEFYKLAGPADMPEIVPIVWMEPESLARGVIGMGEPPVIPVAAAIGNAVRNAIGVRVNSLPITPRKVLAALGTEV